MKKIACVFLIFCGVQTGANADVIMDTARITCAKELKYIELSQTNINGVSAAKAFESKSTSIYKKYGILDIRNFPNIKEKDAKKNENGSFSYFCKIDDKSYEVELSTNRGSPCSGAMILFLTLKENDNVLINKAARYDD
jgi:hypothetical protein